MRDASATSPRDGHPTPAAQAEPLRITVPHASGLKDFFLGSPSITNYPKGQQSRGRDRRWMVLSKVDNEPERWQCLVLE